MKYVGVEDKNEPFNNHNSGWPESNPPVYMKKVAVNGDAEVIAETAKYRVYQVR
jgi:hypothetical protein